MFRYIIEVGLQYVMFVKTNTAMVVGKQKFDLFCSQCSLVSTPFLANVFLTPLIYSRLGVKFGSCHFCQVLRCKVKLSVSS